MLQKKYNTRRPAQGQHQSNFSCFTKISMTKYTPKLLNKTARTLFNLWREQSKTNCVQEIYRLRTHRGKFLSKNGLNVKVNSVRDPLCGVGNRTTLCAMLWGRFTLDYTTIYSYLKLQFKWPFYNLFNWLGTWVNFW